MKILRTIGILAIVSALVVGGAGSAFAKGPPEGVPQGGENSHSKHGLFGTAISTDGYVVTVETKDGQTVAVTLPENAKYKVPGETKGQVDRDAFEMILDGAVDDGDITAIVGKRVAVLVKDLAEDGDPPPDFTATAIRLMLIPIGPPLHAHRVGIVQEPFIPTEDGSIIIIDNHGEPHIFGIDGGINGTTVYRPDGTEATDIVPGSVVTVVTTGDPKNADNDVAKAIVLHEDLPEWALGKIIVDKVTDPTDSLVDFEFSPSWTSNFFLADATTPEDSGWLLPGSYSVSEIVPTGWTLLSAVTDDDDGSDPGSITLDPGETVTVTFTNELID